jgi:hypothetical protein
VLLPNCGLNFFQYHVTIVCIKETMAKYFQYLSAFLYATPITQTRKFNYFMPRLLTTDEDKLMSPCNFGYFECIEGNQHVRESEVTLNCLNIMAAQGVMDLCFEWVILPVFVFFNAFVHTYVTGLVAQLDLAILFMKCILKWCVFESHVGCFASCFNPV